jgi:hypothetical protein
LQSRLGATVVRSSESSHPISGRVKTGIVAAALFASLSSVEIAFASETGLDFPGNAAVSTTMRFRFRSPLSIYPATYIWIAYPRHQRGYYTTFFWANDDGQGDLSNFLWDSGSSNSYYGAHPYPNLPDDSTHKWEIATDRGGDFVSSQNVVYNRWYVQALVAWADAQGRKQTRFYWDLPDTTKVVSNATDATYGNR